MEDDKMKTAAKIPDLEQKTAKKRHRRKRNRKTAVNPAEPVKTLSSAAAADHQPLHAEDTSSMAAPKPEAAAVSESLPEQSSSAEDQAVSAVREQEEDHSFSDAEKTGAVLGRKTAEVEPDTGRTDTGSGKPADAPQEESAAGGKDKTINVVVKSAAAGGNETADPAETAAAGKSETAPHSAGPEGGQDLRPETASSPKKASRKNPHDSVLIYHPEEFRKPLNLQKMILDPQSCQEKEAEFNAETCSRGILQIAVKCAVIALVFSNLIAKGLNRYSFSYVRMTFTGAAWLTLRLFLILAVAEAAYAAVTHLFHYICQRRISFPKLIRVIGAGSLSSAAAYFLAGLFWRISAPFGAIAILGAAVYSIILKTFGTAFVSSLTRRKQLLCVCFAYCALALFVLIGFYLFAGDLVRVWNDLITF